MLGQRPSDELISWMSDQAKHPSPFTVSPEMIRQARPQNVASQDWKATITEEICKSIQDALGEGKVVVASLAAESKQGQKYGICGTGQKLNSFIQSLSIEREIELTLSNLSAKRIYIGVAGVRLHLDNCNIAELSIADGIIRTDVTSLHTIIGTLQISSKALNHYAMQGGSLLNVICPPPSGGNPFTGTVSFKNVFFPRKRRRFILQGPQPYRNLRHHLRNLENAQMANLIHSAELAVEREDDSWTNRILSYLYEWMSDFGSSALRPLLWQGLLFVLSMLLILSSDGAVPAFSEPISALIGWQTLLVDTNISGDYARAIYLALQPLVNPIGIFGPKSLLVPRYPWLAVWLSLHGILAVVLLALLIFAIRRRFKIQ